MILLPVPRDRPLARTSLLLGGLVVLGASCALIVRADLGVIPWDVLHQGLSRTLGLGIGTWSIILGALLLLTWIPLRARAGLGTVLNVVVIGLVIDVTLAVVPPLEGLPLRVGALVVGIVLNGVATGAYIGAGLGPGPRDGLSTAIAARGHPLRLVRTSVEVLVVVAGFFLGGQLGVGTVLFALTIGPIMHVTVPLFTLGERGTSTGPRGRLRSRSAR